MNGPEDLKELVKILDAENPDGYCMGAEGAIELQFSNAILVLRPSGSWELIRY